MVSNHAFDIGFHNAVNVPLNLQWGLPQAYPKTFRESFQNQLLTLRLGSHLPV